MTAAKLNLLRHLAEKVMDRREHVVPLHSSRLHWPEPIEDYYIVGGPGEGLVFGYVKGVAQYWNPLEDANAALAALQALPTEQAAEIVLCVGNRWLEQASDFRPYPTKDVLFHVCLAAAKATGYQP